MEEKILEDRATRLADWRRKTLLTPDETNALSAYVKSEGQLKELSFFGSFLYMANQHGHA